MRPVISSETVKVPLKRTSYGSDISPDVVSSLLYPQHQRSIGSSLRLPPVVFVGSKAHRALPNNASVPPIVASASPQQRLDLRLDGANQRRQLTHHLRRGLGGLAQMISHSPEPRDNVADDAAVPLQRHVGVRGSKRKAPGIDFSDAALFASTVVGGTLMGLTMHHHEDILCMRPMTVVTLDELALGDEAQLSAHETVAAHCGTEAHVAIEDVLMERGYRTYHITEANDRVALRQQRKFEAQHVVQSASPGSAPTDQEARTGSCVSPSCVPAYTEDLLDMFREHRRGATRTEARGGSPVERGVKRPTISRTIANRLKDRDINFIPADHAGPVMPTTLAESKLLRDMRSRRNLQPPSEVAEDFKKLLHRDRSQPVVAELPLSVELRMEGELTAQRRPTVGCGTQRLLQATFELTTRSRTKSFVQQSRHGSRSGSVASSGPPPTGNTVYQSLLGGAALEDMSPPSLGSTLARDNVVPPSPLTAPTTATTATSCLPTRLGAFLDL